MLEGNNLLATLASDDRRLIEPFMVPVRLAAEAVLYEPGETVRHAYFPQWSAMAAFLVLLDDGVAVETTMVGHEGAIGGIVSQGSLPAYSRCQVLHEGSFYRISSQDLEAAKDKSLSLRHLFARYSDCMMAQVFQSVACNATHTIEQRAAKWLCAAVERTGMRTVVMTQEQLASMMGIGRSYASRVLQRLKADGLIQTRRGGIDVIDPVHLSHHACTCNAAVKRHYDTVLKGVYPDAVTIP